MNEKGERMLGWHFLATSLNGPVLRDGRLAPAVGEWLEHNGDIVPCKSGLHFSENPLDALRYSPGPVLCKVECDGDLQSHGNPVDKWVCRRRRILWQLDIHEKLRDFSRAQSLKVVDLWNCTPVVMEWLKTGNQKLMSNALLDVRSAEIHENESAAGFASDSVFWSLLEFLEK